MAASFLTLTLGYVSPLRTLTADLRREWGQDLQPILANLVGGDALPGCSITVADGGTRASGTVTMSGTVTAADTVTIAGTVFTAVNSAPANNQFLSTTGATAALTTPILDLIRAVNASTTAAFKGIGYMTATSATIGTFTVNAVGPVGNFVALSKSGTNISVSGALLTGGASNATVSLSY